ncbi:MAG: acetyl-CoA carboxylase, carboxyltransferase subunit beta [Christensenellaceae bacterium]|jgi:acetyl-CoA carboxylase carboxyl transferase subunit beta|nr:acetyl-CoA carboxylase, carboxyltransferase subunit beta [Christensenellaceae bacterium]
MMLKRSLFKRPKIALENGGEDFSSFLQECPGCGKEITQGELFENLHVCPHCGRHFRLSARQRLAILADEGSFIELDAELGESDPLSFPGYAEKLQNARRASGEGEAVLTGTAMVLGQKTALFLMEGGFMMGSMGSLVGEKLARLFEHATEERLPVVGFTISGGARMQEGILSLMQMAKVSGAVKLHSESGLLYLAVLTDPTTGGVTASFAMEGDITLAEPGALIAFAGPRVIEQTTHKKLPEGFQRAEFLLKNGFIDAICERKAQRETIAALLAYHEGAREGENDHASL